ncbi:MAG: methyltransferase domain-containing protein [Spirochaetes bacterium]|nr:methyltransferase domain-containing protein [Spirochaetota bacterium]
MKLYNELAEHYFAIESHHRNIDDDIEFIVHASQKTVGKTLLDLGCGSGEHCFELYRRGFRCTGIDISDQMLKIARERFPSTCTFLKFNILQLPFAKEFDIAISLFGTMNYFIENPDILTAFTNAKRALRKGGVAIFEIWNSFPVHKIRQKKLSHISTTHSCDATIERYRGFSIIEESPRTIVEVNYRYIIRDSNGSRELTDQHIMRAFSYKEIAQYLTNAGFQKFEIFSSSRKQRYHLYSNRLLVVAT